MQTYTNHVHRPVLWATGLLCWGIALAGGISAARGRPWGAWMLAGGLLATTFVVLLIGRIYITRLQDRIIRLEMRVRAATLLTAAQQAQLAALPKGKVVALRFASDAELPALLDRTVAENLSPRDIKQAVTHWQPDLHRT